MSFRYSPRPQEEPPEADVADRTDGGDPRKFESGINEDDSLDTKMISDISGNKNYLKALDSSSPKKLGGSFMESPNRN